MSLFTAYEERPPFCQAALVWFDTVEDIAAYYGEGGYETDVKRNREGVTLTIRRDPCERVPEGFELSVTLSPFTGSTRQMLVYGHPPTLVDEQEFHRRWREAKELP